MSTYTLVIEKWQVRPEPKWIFLKEQQVSGRETAKRVKLTDGRVFNKLTGAQVTRNHPYRMYKFSLRISKEQAA